MQRFPCPFCGLRDESEFTFVSEVGKTRPDTTQDVSAESWQAYLYAYVNPKGPSEEIWVHTPCQEYFVMARDTTTMAVLSASPLRKDEA